MAGISSQTMVPRFTLSTLLLGALIMGAMLVLPVAEVAAQAASEEASSVQATPLKGRDVKRVQKEASAALAAGDFGTAITKFEHLLATFSGEDPRRAGALYSLAVASLFRPAQPGNTARAEKALRELDESFPKFERHAEVKLLAAGLRAQVAAQATADRHDQELRELAELQAQVALHQGEVEACSAELAALDEQRETGSEQSAALQREVRNLRARLAEVEAELAKKEEALEKVKATLVGG